MQAVAVGIQKDFNGDGRAWMVMLNVLGVFAPATRTGSRTL